MLNLVVLHGRMTDDPTFDVVGEKELTKFTIAVDDSYRKDYAHFIDVEAWGKVAEVIANNFNKGKEILIHGQLDHQRWEKDGQKRSRIKVKLNSFDFCGKKDE